MSLYSAAVATPAAAAGAAYLTINTPATRRARILEVGAFCTAATASSMQLIRPNNTPVASTNVLGQALDPNDVASVVNIGTAWSTAPTIGTNVPLKRFVSQAAIGSGVIWVFPDKAPLILNVSSWLVLWNFGAGAGSILSAYVTWDE